MDAETDSVLDILFFVHPILVHPILGASYLDPSVPSSVVPYISVSYFSTSYFWFFLSLRFPFLNPNVGISYVWRVKFVTTMPFINKEEKTNKCNYFGTFPWVLSECSQSDLRVTSECSLYVLYVVHCFHRTGSLSVFWCIAVPRPSLTNAEVLKFYCLHRSCFFLWQNWQSRCACLSIEFNAHQCSIAVQTIFVSFCKAWWEDLICQKLIWFQNKCKYNSIFFSNLCSYPLL